MRRVQRRRRSAQKIRAPNAHNTLAPAATAAEPRPIIALMTFPSSSEVLFGSFSGKLQKDEALRTGDAIDEPPKYVTDRAVVRVEIPFLRRVRFLQIGICGQYIQDLLTQPPTALTNLSIGHTSAPK